MNGGGRMIFGFSGQSRELLTAAFLLSLFLAKDRSQTELESLGAFFAVLGDSLALLSLFPSSKEDQPRK